MTAPTSFYTEEMETLRINIIECIQNQMAHMNPQQVYYVLHPLMQEFKVLYENALQEQLQRSNHETVPRPSETDS